VVHPYAPTALPTEKKLPVSIKLVVASDPEPVCMQREKVTPVFLLLVGWDLVPCTVATSGLLYQPQMIATLFTTNPT
jgi:hypothetical protein